MNTPLFPEVIFPVPFDWIKDEQDMVWKPQQELLNERYHLAQSHHLIVGLPMGNHPGAFGVQRTHHIHEGIDLYVPYQTPVQAVCDGVIRRIEWFTGEKAQSPWWRDTQAILIEDQHGGFNYGEITVNACWKVGQHVKQGDILGWVIPVLRHQKQRPIHMLHLERYLRGSNESVSWPIAQPQPSYLLDPTPAWLQTQKNRASLLTLFCQKIKRQGSVLIFLHQPVKITR